MKRFDNLLNGAIILSYGVFLGVCLFLAVS